MKLRCVDGKVRSFQPCTLDGVKNPKYGNVTTGGVEAHCEECGLEFGFHDTSVLKPKFKAHVCKQTTVLRIDLAKPKIISRMADDEDESA